jgi:hypothetical protein
LSVIRVDLHHKQKLEEFLWLRVKRIPVAPCMFNNASRNTRCHRFLDRLPCAIVVATPICILAGCERSMKMTPATWALDFSLLSFTCIRGDGVEDSSPK